MAVHHASESSPRVIRSVFAVTARLAGRDHRRPIVNDRLSSAQAARARSEVDATPGLSLTQAERALLQEFLQRLAAEQLTPAGAVDRSSRAATSAPASPRAGTHPEWPVACDLQSGCLGLTADATSPPWPVTDACRGRRCAPRPQCRGCR